MNNKARIYSILIIVLVYILISSIPFSLFINDELIIFLIKNGLRIAFIIFFFVFIKKNELHKLLLEKINGIKCAVSLPFIFLCISNLLVILIAQSNVVQNVNGLTLIFAIISSLLVSMCEEFVFRAILLTELTAYYSPIKAIIISSLLFGLIHLVNITSFANILPTLLQVLYSIGTGFVFGFLYLYHKNVVVPILFHFLFNAINNDLVNNLFVLEWNYIFFLINGVIAIIIVIYFMILIFNKRHSVLYDLDMDNHNKSYIS